MGKDKISNFKIQAYRKYVNDETLILRYWDKSKNFGDYMNPYLLEKITGKQVVSSYKIFNFLNKAELLGIGSIIGGNLSKCYIWGSGIISPDTEITKKPKGIFHVRGKLTKKVLEQKGIKVPDLYGDPALLLPRYFKVEKNKKYKLGIIPHYSELNTDLVKTFKNKYLSSDHQVISPLEDFREVIRKINQCDYIASSSLHGLIVAEAYGIPSLRLFISPLRGGDFKFNDYYSSLNIENHEIFDLQEFSKITSESFFSKFTKKEIIIDQEKLISNVQEFFGKR